MKVAILGAGLTGLTAGYKLAQAGHEVHVFEKEKKAGGLARGFKLPGWDWHLDETYHHLFTSDKEAIELINELDMADKLFFQKPETAVYYQSQEHKNTSSSVILNLIQNLYRFRVKPGMTKKPKPITNSNIYPLDTPLNFLRFPHLSPLDKLRSGTALAYLKSISSWQHLEKTPAKKWIEKYMGKKVWQVLWKPLFINKFGKSADQVSAAWFWARIKKRSQSLGYIEGGFQTLVEKLVKEIEKLGGKVYLNHEVKNLTLIKHQPNQKFSFQVKNSCGDRPMNFYFEKVITTLPTPFFLKTTKGLSQNYIKILSSIKHLNALTLILVLKKPFFDKTYWLNICDSSFPFLLLVDHTNFIKPQHYGGQHILYIGNYLPDGHPYLKKSKKELLNLFLPYLKRINPSFNNQQSTINNQQFISKHSQPVFPPHYSQILTSLTTPLPNLFLANQDLVYPWDRGTNYAIKLGKKVAKLI